MSVLYCTVCAVFAQKPAAPPTFDVASVKRLPADAPRRGSTYQTTPVGITFQHATLGNCVMWA